MGWKPNHGRIKPKYNPRPNAEELAYHRRLIGMPCICCGARSQVVHHVLQSTPLKRWRRDHMFVVPMADACHKSLHAAGNEAAWCKAKGIDIIEIAERLRSAS